MSDNCYKRTAPTEEYAAQENRLTNRHIQTLGLLHDLHVENGELKTRVDELEKELENCGEYHTIAKEAKDFKQRAQEDCLKQIDKNNHKLTRKHKEEVMSLISAKLEAETEWLQERDMLQQLIDQHEKQNAALTEQLEALKKHDLKVDVVNQRLDLSIKEMLELKDTNKQLHLQIQHLEERENVEAARHCDRVHEIEKEKESLSLELQVVSQRLKEFELKVKVMDNELLFANNVEKERNSAKSKLRQQLDDASKRIGDGERRIGEVEEEVSDLKRDLARRTEQLEREVSTKEKLLVLLQQSQGECNSLKGLLAAREQEKEQAPERVGFREFVQMRRELNALREESEWLKQSRRRPRSLPSIKGTSPDGGAQNGISQRSQKVMKERQAKSETAIQLCMR